MFKKKKIVVKKGELSKEELEELYDKLPYMLKFKILEFYSYDIYHTGGFVKFSINKKSLVKVFFGRFKVDPTKTIFLIFLKVRFIWNPQYALMQGLPMTAIKVPIKSLLPKDIRYIYILAEGFNRNEITTIALHKDQGDFTKLRNLTIYYHEFAEKNKGQINVKNIQENLEELTIYINQKDTLQNFFSLNWKFEKLKNLKIVINHRLYATGLLKIGFSSLKKIKILSGLIGAVNHVNYFSPFPQNLTYLMLPAVDQDLFKFDGFKNLKTLYLKVDPSLSNYQIEELNKLKYLETLIIGDKSSRSQNPLIRLNQNIMELFLIADNLKFLYLYYVDMSNISLEGFNKNLKPKTIIIQGIMYRENLIDFYEKLNNLVNLKIIIDLTVAVVQYIKYTYSNRVRVIIPFSEFEIINHLSITENSRIYILSFVYHTDDDTYAFGSLNPNKEIPLTRETIRIMKTIFFKYNPLPN